MNNKVYLVVRQWKDFEDYDCNGMQIEGVYDNRSSAINGCLNAIYEELNCDMDFLERENKLTFKEVVDKVAKNEVLSLKQKEGNGITTIYILEREVLK